MLKLFNSLSRKVEEFKPLNPPKVGVYICGPTVYDFMHIGNLRTFILGDIIHRVLDANNYQVTFVQNITDIDDKIIKRAVEKRITIQELASEYTQYFFDDLLKLNILPADVYPKATEHIGKMIKYIEELLKKDLAYEKEGSVYFDISKFPDYGKLSRVDKRELKTGTRVLSDEYTKDNVQDFALWKAVENDDDVGWDSPWGKGRPGWHIECSVMSQEYLGETLDIHAGGTDLMFPHHENEIAQSEGKTDKPFVNYFIHGEMLLVDGGKMGKRFNNFYKISDLIEIGIEPLAYRYLTMTAIYRDQLNFTSESLQAAQNALNNIRSEVRDWGTPEGKAGEYYRKFLAAVNNDLNMPQAIAVMHELISSDLATNKKSTEILAMDKIMGLGLDQYVHSPLDVPKEVKKLVQDRENARKSKDFAKSDELREKIKDLGFEVEDTPGGPKIKSST